ncbi:50S ribosomal protein L5 [Candidatus Pacearchaeota archaeon CG1_02_30_18]|nr:MAG: 50S ribosomal protein L5 [Candidatus Pacearchaeota archaeon CG1_02_30_18]PIN71685.1 MAG: 50S ribosomal protein L5 [Candidatus Pacearchaeota archaeon CG11_big_fil_rev_8_21_14_0_20_30_13]PJA71703.1 MAG: 50S ribosomal protein L5 [Candidatus Pacearchaeota archaeon CG_4_9_14_3_um_filter_30_11]
MEEKTQNKMREIKIEKVVLNIGGTGDYLIKGFKLLEIITNKKPSKTTSSKRIPGFGVRPGLEVGTVVTLRKDAEEVLKRMLSAVENKIKKKQVSENNFSFGVKEYIEIPGMEYHRDIGIMGLDITVVFKRAGKRVRLKKIKNGKIPKKQIITKEEIIKFMENRFQTRFK